MSSSPLAATTATSPDTDTDVPNQSRSAPSEGSSLVETATPSAVAAQRDSRATTRAATADGRGPRDLVIECSTCKQRPLPTFTDQLNELGEGSQRRQRRHCCRLGTHAPQSTRNSALPPRYYANGDARPASPRSLRPQPCRPPGSRIRLIGHVPSRKYIISVIKGDVGPHNARYRTHAPGMARAKMSSRPLQGCRVWRERAPMRRAPQWLSIWWARVSPGTAARPTSAKIPGSEGESIARARLGTDRRTHPCLIRAPSLRACSAAAGGAGSPFKASRAPGGPAAPRHSGHRDPSICCLKRETVPPRGAPLLPILSYLKS